MISPPIPTTSKTPSLLASEQEVQNWPRRNILRNRVLPPRDGFPDPLEACFPHCLLQCWLGPTPIPPSPRLPPGEPSRDPVLETIQVPLYPRGKHPRLHPEQQHCLQHRFLKIPDTFGSAPSRINVRDSRSQLFLALLMLPTTAGQLSSLAVNTRPRYLNAVTFTSGSTYAVKALSVLSLSSASASRRLFRSAPLADCVVTFVFCDSPCVISAAWDAAAMVAFCAMIMYLSIVKHVSYCYHLVTSI